MKDLACLLARGDHAATCPRCREAAAQDRAVAALAARVPTEHLPPRARDHALDLALASAMPAPRRVRWLVPAGLALAAAAAIAIVIVVGRGGAAPAPARPRLALIAGATTLVGHARVTPSSGAVAWQRGDAEVVLDAGHVDVEVDPAPHRRFRVVTPAFNVDVLGTVFAVDHDGVSVSRGAVRITSPAGVVLVDRLAAGERWSPARTERTPELAPPPEPEPEPDQPTESDPDVDPARPSPPAAAHARTAQAWVAEARSLLAGGDVGGARAAVQKALALRPPRAVRADAEMLIAESYLKSGELDTAVTHFRGVADRYRDLATGEAALFAAARYELRLGHKDAGRRLLETYLDRYPDGFLATQARAQLGAP